MAKAGSVSARPSKIRVAATAFGFYGEKRREGDVFEIDAAELDKDVVVEDARDPRLNGKILRRKGEIKDFAPSWMRIVDGTTPLRKQTAAEHSGTSLADVLAGKMPKLQTNAADPLEETYADRDSLNVI